MIPIVESGWTAEAPLTPMPIPSTVTITVSWSAREKRPPEPSGNGRTTPIAAAEDTELATGRLSAAAERDDPGPDRGRCLRTRYHVLSSLTRPEWPHPIPCFLPRADMAPGALQHPLGSGRAAVWHIGRLNATLSSRRGP